MMLSRLGASWPQRRSPLPIIGSRCKDYSSCHMNRTLRSTATATTTSRRLLRRDWSTLTKKVLWTTWCWRPPLSPPVVVVSSSSSSCPSFVRTSSASAVDEIQQDQLHRHRDGQEKNEPTTTTTNTPTTVLPTVTTVPAMTAAETTISTSTVNTTTTVRITTTDRNTSSPVVEQTQPASTNISRTSSGSSSSSSSSSTSGSNNKVRADYTIDRTKSGTASPWAVFDAWGAGADLGSDTLSAAEQDLLLPSSVRIPVQESDRDNLPNETDILHAYDHFLQGRSSVHFGYPYNLMFDFREVMQFLKYSINNLGDPFVPSNYGVHSRQFEVAVIDFFAQLWRMTPGSYWGYITTSGTEGNLHGILLARERFPTGILYTSQETHYSVFKAARYYRMECQSIPTLPMGEINYDLLKQAIHENRHVPVILNVNIGTTVKGAVDNLDRIIRILEQLQIPRDQYYIHCDGALFALMMPFIESAPEVSFRKPIDSMTVSGHKMLGSPMPCGVALCRKEHVTNVENRIDYLNSVDTTIMGSRNGHAALYMWYSLRKKGLAGIKRDVMECMDTARYLRDKLSHAGFICRLNDLSSTVCLERPMSEDLVQRWQLACQEDIAHVVVMPNVTRTKIDRFVEELLVCANELGHQQPLRADSPLMQLHTTW